MEAYGMWELGVWGVFLSPAVAFLLKGHFLPPLVLPLPDLTSSSPVMACSLLAGRLVRTFTHGIALLPSVGYGLSWSVCVLGGLVLFLLLCLCVGFNYFVCFLRLFLSYWYIYATIQKLFIFTILT